MISPHHWIRVLLHFRIHVVLVHTAKSRFNTLEEKRKMRNARKKRKRHRYHSTMSTTTKSAPPTEAHTVLQSELEKERKRAEIAESKIGVYKSMSRSYWERWRWKLQKRKEAVLECKKLQCYGHSSIDTIIQGLETAAHHVLFAILLYVYCGIALNTSALRPVGK